MSKAHVGANDTAWARSQANYYSAWCGPSESPAVGLVAMRKYKDWLIGQGINIAYACSSMHKADGPGLITSFGSRIDGRSIYMLSVTLPSGKPAMAPFSVWGSKKPDWRQASSSNAGLSGVARTHFAKPDNAKPQSVFP
jgi:hypothetical protein